jgi:hypothetical protein
MVWQSLRRNNQERNMKKVEQARGMMGAWVRGAGAAAQGPARKRWFGEGLKTRLRSASILAAIPLAITQAFAVQTTATWGGSGCSSYATASNWDIGQVPLNNANTSYIVQILGAGKCVSYSVINPQQIDQFLLDVSSSFNLTAGSLILPTSLTVLGKALIAGSINANNATFTALGAGTSFLGNTTTVSASNGGVVRIGGTLFNASGLSNATIISATGVGSLVDLPNVQTLDVGQAGGSNDFITATGGASIKLSGVTKLIAPATGVSLIFSANSGANVDLSSLQTLGGVTQDSGSTVFNLDSATTTIGALQKANRLFVNLQNASTMNIGGYAGVGDITNSTFTVAGGSKLNAAALVGTLSERGFSNVTLLSASGNGSLLDLSGVQTLDVGQAGGSNDFVTATSGANIKLSGVTKLIAPATGVSLIFNANSGANIDLSSLQALGGLTADSGSTVFNVDSATTTVGALEKANRLFVDLRNGSSMNLGGYAGTADITNSVFNVAGGSKLNAAALVGTLNERGFSNVTLLSAAGNGSVLDLSGIKTLDVGQAGGSNDYITATSGSKINLAGVTTLIAPVNAGVGIIFTANSGANINLASLQTIVNTTGGQVNFNIASAGSMLMRGINAGPGVNFNLVDAGSKLTVAGSLAMLTGSTMVAGAGSAINVSGGLSFQQKVASQFNLDASTLTFDGSGGQTLEIGSKRIGLPGVGTVVASNFAIGQLFVGQTSGATVLSLTDLIDNGNRAGGAEALYLNGSGNVNGLHILGGSTLALGNLDLYTTQSGQWIHINDLFTNGVTTIAYDAGFITLTTAPVPEPGKLATLLAGLGIVAARRRFLSSKV